jgi:hypothetical protein
MITMPAGQLIAKPVTIPITRMHLHRIPSKLVQKSCIFCAVFTQGEFVLSIGKGVVAAGLKGRVGLIIFEPHINRMRGEYSPRVIREQQIYQIYQIFYQIYQIFQNGTLVVEKRRSRLE